MKIEGKLTEVVTQDKCLFVNRESEIKGSNLEVIEYLKQFTTKQILNTVGETFPGIVYVTEKSTEDLLPILLLRNSNGFILYIVSFNDQDFRVCESMYGANVCSQSPILVSLSKLKELFEAYSQYRYGEATCDELEFKEFRQLLRGGIESALAKAGIDLVEMSKEDSNFLDKYIHEVILYLR